MADAEKPDRPHDFGDLLGELSDDSSFVWDNESGDADEEAQTFPAVCFRIGVDRFAVSGEAVREILGDPEVTKLPGAPPHIEGITVVRRQVVGLLSLRLFLGLDDDEGPAGADADTAGTNASRTLVIETAHHTVALPVDQVMGLQDWPRAAIDRSSLPENLRPTARRYAQGVREMNGAVVLLLNMESLLDDAAVK